MPDGQNTAVSITEQDRYAFYAYLVDAGINQNIASLIVNTPSAYTASEATLQTILDYSLTPYLNVNNLYNVNMDGVIKWMEGNTAIQSGQTGNAMAVLDNAIKRQTEADARALTLRQSGDFQAAEAVLRNAPFWNQSVETNSAYIQPFEQKYPQQTFNVPQGQQIDVNTPEWMLNRTVRTEPTGVVDTGKAAARSVSNWYGEGSYQAQPVKSTQEIYMESIPFDTSSREYDFLKNSYASIYQDFLADKNTPNTNQGFQQYLTGINWNQKYQSNQAYVRGESTSTFRPRTRFTGGY